MTRKTLAASAGVAALLLAIGAWFVARDHEPVEYRTSPAERGDVDVSVSATGSPNAVITVQVGTQVSGVITELFADWNSKVTKGEQIARIDPAPFQAKVDQAEANVAAARAAVLNAEAVIQQARANIQAATSARAAAQANVVKARAVAEDAEAKVARRVTMVSKGADAKEDLETAQTTYKSARADLEALTAQEQASRDSVHVAEAQLKVATSLLAANQAQVRQAEAVLESARLDLNHTHIHAPVDGVVVSRNVDVGQTVAASLAAPTLFLIAQDLTKMQVDTNVSEADIGRVKVGDPTTFTVDAYPGRVFHGEVTSIREAPINVQNVITYDAVIGVANPDLKLFPGMTASVRILVKRSANVLKIPNAALRYHPAGTPPPAMVRTAGHKKEAPETVVWILGSNGQPERMLIATGETDGTSTEVVSGPLKEGDRVITAALAKSGSPASSGSPRGFGRGPGF